MDLIELFLYKKHNVQIWIFSTHMFENNGGKQVIYT
jgi:hypothetical protein